MKLLDSIHSEIKEDDIDRVTFYVMGQWKINRTQSSSLKNSRRVHLIFVVVEVKIILGEAHSKNHIQEQTLE